MKKLISSTAIAALTLGLPAMAQAQTHYGETYNAHEACKKNEDKRQIIGGLAGAVLGGVVGSQVSGNGARSEGSAIGAVVGGLAGVGIADKTVDCDPVYEPPQYGSSSTYGTGTSHGSAYGTPQNTSYASQPVYTDQVTFSNHPVYTQPTYGAGAVSYGTTQSTGTVTYQPYTPHQSYTVSQPSYTTGSAYRGTPYSGQSYPSYQNQSYQTQAYQTAAPAPTYQTTTYSSPVSYRAPQRRSSHYHGRYACSTHH